MNTANNILAEREITNYVLGEMSAEDQANFEIRYLADDSLYEQVLLVKQELIDGYVRHHLDAATRKQFERYILATPDGQKEVAFASALREKLNQTVQPEVAGTSRFKLSNWWSAWSLRELAFAGVAMLLIVVGAWLFSQNQKLRAELSGLRIQSAEQLRKNTELENQLAELRLLNPTPSPVIPSTPDNSPKQAFQFLAINLSGKDRDSTGTKEIKQPSGDFRLRLNVRLGFRPLGSRCDVTIKTPDGTTFDRRNAPVYKQEGYFVRADFPALKLKAGDYNLIIRGRDADDNTEKIASYSFRLNP